MSNKFTFRKNYLFLFLFFVLVEFIIASFFHDDFVRPFVGDAVVPVLFYTLFSIFLKVPKNRILFWVLMFCFFVEITQYFKLINILGWQHSTAAILFLGTSFSWLDMITYVIGAGVVYFVEKAIEKN